MSPMKKTRNQKILELVQKVLREVLTNLQTEENGGGAPIGNVTAAIDGYQTPLAFQRTPPTKKDIKKQYSHLSSSAYTVKPPTKKQNEEKKVYSLYEEHLKD